MILPHSIAAQLVVPEFAARQVGLWAQAGVQRVLNSLPEGLLIALFAWTVLRLLPKQNSRTRFAVWFLALLAVVGTACLGGLLVAGLTHGLTSIPGLGSEGQYAINLPANWASYLVFAWLVAACVAILRVAIGIFRLRELRKSCQPVDASTLDPSIRQTLAELNAAKSFASRPVTLATSDHVRVPAALGLWKPLIALPSWALAELPPSDLNIILRHEFAHLRRWDDWTNLLQKTVRALFFFHPAVWWIENRLSVEREMACDDMVLAQTDNPMGYASCLVSLLERSLAQRGWTMAQAIVHRAREASDRLTRILDKNRPTATDVSKPALGLVGAFALLCVVMLPQTPQLVAFDQSPHPVPEYSAALLQPEIFRAADSQGSFRPAGVIPASLKGIEPAPRKNFKPVSARITTTSQPSDRQTRGSSSPPSSPSLIELSSLLNQDAQNLPAGKHPVFFVEETKFVMLPDQASGASESFKQTAATRPTSTILRIEVWRVTVVNTVWERPAQAPVTHKI